MMTRRLYGRALRQLFGDVANTHATVDGLPVPLQSLSVRTMNFGQPWRTAGVREVSYALRLPIAFFLAFLDEPEQLPDLISDAKSLPDPADSLTRHLIDSNAHYAADAMAVPALAQELAKSFAHEALLRWLGDGAPDLSPGYVLNSIDRVIVDSSGVALEGKGCLARSTDTSPSSRA